MSGVWRLTVRGQFSAAHALRNYHGKCENLHGHNFDVEVSVEGSQLDASTGMLLDFGILKQLLRTALAGLDHANLNELQSFADVNPSSENLAKYIWDRMEELLAVCPECQARIVRLACVSVSENGTQTATWFGNR